MTPQPQEYNWLEISEEMQNMFDNGNYSGGMVKQMIDEKCKEFSISPAPSPEDEEQYKLKGYVTFSKVERDKIIAFLSQPFGKETIKEMREIVRRHEQESLRTGGEPR